MTALHMEIPVEKIPFGRYPRPQAVRNNRYQILNGTWSCGVTVPFPLQSELSGFKGEVPDRYRYYTTFELTAPVDPASERLLLHFGAVDQVCSVFVDGHPVGHHEGGYLPFTFEITDFLADTEQHRLEVDVTDTLSQVYPYGKQTKNRGGMWYTPVTGIWQTVWLEVVPKQYIHEFRITPGLDHIRLEADCSGDMGGFELETEIYAPAMHKNPALQVITRREDVHPGDLEIAAPELKPLLTARVNATSMSSGTDTITYAADLKIPDAKLWSPDEPWLYGIRLKCGRDEVYSYFGLRTLEIRRAGSHKRVLFNGKPFFFHGVLDQGYYPEGIFLPNSEAGYELDIQNMKDLGFNTLRKHIKVEPACYYEACDRIGMIVWQDMVNNSDYGFMRDTVFPTFGIKAANDHFMHTKPEERAFFEQHMKDTIRALYNFPCICYYTIFNEGWGQFESDRLYGVVKELDPTRIVDSTSGWFRQLKSDVVSRHVYYHPVAQLYHFRPVMISEFGGYSYREPGHVFNTSGNYGYKNFQDKEALAQAIYHLYERDIFHYVALGCCGSIYTQVSDVEDETNGCYTYDRQVCKTDPETMRQIARRLQELIGNVKWT